jgi:hypothetical protein
MFASSSNGIGGSPMATGAMPAAKYKKKPLSKVLGQKKTDHDALYHLSLDAL